ncbi:hypothetical protein [Nocardia sp. CA-120079]|uniref:hypothetical protein n=1 Tax=Nocardia sp. CA-120079 TaxID=3239974 RepID=UPI003D98B216
MSLASFNIVLVGENFPISNIKASDFIFNHRQLQETLRLPVALQAQTRGVMLQILPERFEAAVSDSRSVALDAERLSEMVSSIFEYIGPKSIKAVGHNAQYIVEGTEGRKKNLSQKLLSDNLINNSLGISTDSADVHVYFWTSTQKRGRLGFLTETDNPRTVLDFNINFDVANEGGSREAIANLSQSMQEIEAIATRAEALFSPEHAK